MVPVKPLLDIEIGRPSRRKEVALGAAPTPRNQALNIWMG
ncbi:hypothetical protein C357_16221 [Citreicella sp. 357]|jgi:hypothetical protein|nr:hypothetical protein C357_16221 [Citreicella sp. 357]